MEKYAVLSAVSRGSFWERLCHLYMKTGDYLDMERLESRSVRYVKVFLSDARNQYAQLLESQLWAEYLSKTQCAVIEQPPLDGSKISLLVNTSDKDGGLMLSSVRLTEDEAAGSDACRQAELLVDKYVKDAGRQGLAPAGNHVCAWIYLSDTDADCDRVVKACDDIFRRYGLVSSARCVEGACVEGRPWAKGASVAMDFLTFAGTGDTGTCRIDSSAHPCPSTFRGVASGFCLRVCSGGVRRFVVSGTAGIGGGSEVMYRDDVKKQAGRLLENIGEQLKKGGATMKDIRYFVIYLRDLSDYAEADKFMSIVFPYTPRVIVRAKGNRPERLVEMECVAVQD